MWYSLNRIIDALLNKLTFLVMSLDHNLHFISNIYGFIDKMSAVILAIMQEEESTSKSLTCVFI